MANTVRREGDIIKVDYIGPQDYQTASGITSKNLEFCKQLQTEGKPVLVLIHVDQVTTQDSGARKASMEAMQTLPLDKMAVVGAPLFIRHVAQFVARAAGKADKVKYFDSESAALEWLNS